MYDTPLVIFFEGEAEGGTVSLNVLRAVGEDLAVETFTKAGERPRQVVNRLADLLEEAGLERVVELDHAQETLVLNSALDVDLAIEDEGLLAAFQFADEALEIDNTSFSGLSQPYGETTDGDASDPDAAVLQSLASYVGHLADQGEISSDLRERLNLTQALYMEVLGVLTQRKTEISLPNPGEGVPLATTNAAVQGVADQLAGHVPAMLKGSADLSDARGKQMDAIEKKEREAKQGGGGGGEGGDKGKGEGGDGQDDTTQNKKPEIGEASPGAPAGQGAGSAGKVGVHRAGTDDPLAEHIAAEEILHVTGRGLDLVIARIGDEWYAAKGRVNKEFKLADGKTVIRPEWDLGSFDKDAPPEAKPIKIDFEKLQEFIKKANDAARKPDDGGTSVAKVISIALDFVPVIGDIKGAAETLLGYNLLTNEKLSTTERALGGALLLLPFFGRLIKGASKVGLHTAARLADTGGEIAEQGLRNLDEFAEAIVKTRRADSADASVRTVTRNADNVDEARHLPGASATRGKCFKVGTPVVRADGTLVPIENLVPGDEILAAADAPSLASMVPARVSTAIRQTVHRGVQISFTRDGNGETDDVTCTPRHPIATERGYVSAEDLQPDDRLLLAEGTATLSKLEPVTTAFEVIKLVIWN